MNPYQTQTDVGNALMGLAGFVRYHVCTTDIDGEMGVSVFFDTQQRATDHCTDAGGGQVSWGGFPFHVAVVSGVKVVYRW